MIFGIDLKSGQDFVDMGKFIALQGKGSTGKTTTLRYLIALLQNAATLVEQKPLSSGLDTWAIFEYNSKYIAITTRGDTSQYICNDFSKMESIAKSKQFKIDTYVCAIRSYGDTVYYINNKSTTLSYELEIYGRTTYSSTNMSQNRQTQMFINTCQANMIFHSL